MLQNKKYNQDNHQKRVRPADRKLAELNSGEGRAKNRRGITYGSREAGRASEHFEPGGRLGIHHTHGSNKEIQGNRNGETKPVKHRKHNEQRIVSG